MAKKIIYFTPAHRDLKNAASMRSFWFVKTLREQGDMVDVLEVQDLWVPAPHNQQPPIVRLIFEFLGGVELFLRVFFAPRGRRFIFSLPPFFTVLLGATAAVLSLRKFSLDIRDLYPQVLSALGLLKENGRVFGFLQSWINWLYRRASTVVAATEGLRKEILASEPNVCVQLIMNGFDAGLFYPVPLGEKNLRFTAVFHGNLGRFQRVDLVVELARLCPEIDFLVIGDGPAAKYLRDAPTNLRYLGPMSIEELAPHVRRCHVGLSFRTEDRISTDAFPVKVFEYLGAGLPIIVTPPSEAGEFVEREKVGVALRNDVAAIAEVLRRWHREGPPPVDGSRFLPYSRQELSKGARLLVEQ
ncbi:MAG: glycosyltransferase [Bdellovibrionaceae bacterium]|nr:glycosyltransferase [Pseudobdellovibrionaceae bacterium]